MDNETSESGERRAFKRSLRQVIVFFVFENLWQIISAFCGTIFGAAAVYLAIWMQISNAKHAADNAKQATDDLKIAITALATRDYVDAQKERIDELAEWRLGFKEDVKESRMVKPKEIAAARKKTRRR